MRKEIMRKDMIYTYIKSKKKDAMGKSFLCNGLNFLTANVNSPKMQSDEVLSMIMLLDKKKKYGIETIDMNTQYLNHTKMMKMGMIVFSLQITGNMIEWLKLLIQVNRFCSINAYKGPIICSCNSDIMIFPQSTYADIYNLKKLINGCKNIQNTKVFFLGNKNDYVFV